MGPKTAQLLARHSDINLTMNTYTMLGVLDQVAAVEALPPVPESKALRAAGDGDVIVPANAWPVVAHTPRKRGVFVGLALADQPQVHMDESPTKEADQKAWLWTAVAPLFAVFGIFPSRAATAIGHLLGEAYAGIVNCDRAKMYWRIKHLQWCWAHLKRDFQALIDHPDRQVKRLGHDLMRQVKLVFQHWWDHRSGKISRKTFQERMVPVRAEVDGLLLRGIFSGNDRLMGMCNELYDHREWLWTFVDQEGVEPTNNTAERVLRHAVIWASCPLEPKAPAAVASWSGCSRQSKPVACKSVAFSSISPPPSKPISANNQRLHSYLPPERSTRHRLATCP